MVNYGTKSPLSHSIPIKRTVPLSAITSTWPLLLGMAVLMLGAGLQGTLLGLRATLEGFPALLTGTIMSCYYVGYVLGTVIALPLVRQIGHIRVFAALAAVASMAILVQGSFVNPLVWAAMRLVSGLISLAMVPIMVSAQQLPERSVPRKVSLPDLYRNSPLGVVGVTVSGLISATIFSMGPVYARLYGLTTTQVAIFMAVSILAAAVTQYPVGRLSDRMDRRTVIAAVCTLATLVAGSIVAFPAMPHAPFLTLAALFSGLVLTLYSLCVSHVND